MPVTANRLEVHLADPDLRIVDIRGHVIPATEALPHYFDHRTDYDKSHILGAINRPRTSLVGADGQFLPPDETPRETC